MAVNTGKLQMTVIKEIYQEHFGQFADLLAEIEVGKHFDSKNQEHIEWLKQKIAVRFFEGTHFYGMFLEDGTPVALAGLLINECLFGPNNSELKDIGTFEQFRRKGYGSQLLAHCEQVSRDNNVYCMYMCTYVKEYYNIAFYGKNGFVPVACLPDIHGPDDEGQVYMRKRLMERGE